jgi:hypothetical protein
VYLMAEADQSTRPDSAARAIRHASRRVTARQPSKNQIRERAYQIFLDRGGSPGRELEDWLQAEKELRAQALAESSNEEKDRQT